MDIVKHFKFVVLKEVKELVRDPRILIGMVIVPVLIFPIMGHLFSTATEATLREMEALPIALIDDDRSELSQMLLDAIKKVPNIVLVDVNGTDWIEGSLSNNVRAIIRVPKGFANNISIGLQGTIEVYLVVRSLSMGETGVKSVVDCILKSFSKTISTTMVNKYAPGVNALTVLEPVIANGKIIVKGEVVDVPPEDFIAVMMRQVMMVPIMMMVLMMMAAQIAVTSIAVEKEEKTLETLLTLPVKRVTILWGKLIGSAIVAAIGVLAYTVSFIYYMNLVSSSQQVPTVSTSYIELPPEGYAVLALSLFFSLMTMLALSILLGAYAQDVRSAQSLVGSLFIPVLIPTFVLMYADPQSLPLSLQIVLYAIPLSHPMIAAKTLFFGDYVVPILGLLYNMAFMVVVLYVAARFFSSEKVVLARITLRRRRSEAL